MSIDMVYIVYVKVCLGGDLKLTWQSLRKKECPLGAYCRTFCIKLTFEIVRKMFRLSYKLISQNSSRWQRLLNHREKRNR